MPYSWLTYSAARTLLAARLLDSSKVFWTDAELKLYLTEALRLWNALTAVFITDYTRTLTPASDPWLTLNTAGSPRQYTVTDADLYTLIQYHLLEPATGAGTWTGTSQFALADLTSAFQKRQDEVIQLTAGNMARNNSIVATPNVRRSVLPDTILDVRRAKFVPANLSVPPQVLWREDPYAFASFTPSYRQTAAIPRAFSVSDQPPLTLDVDFPPNQPGNFDLLTVNSGTPPAPPAAVTLGIPDDWAWVVKYGMLSDLLGKQSESQDIPRAQYCLARYQEGIRLMQQLPWLLTAQLNNVSCGIVAVLEKDQYSAGWEEDTGARPGVVIAGTDLYSVSPRPAGNVSVTLQIVQSAPIPAADGDFVQASRDTFDAILDYAVHLATFKQGGAEFQATIPLFDNFRKSAMAVNNRIGQLAEFDDVMKVQGRREEDVDPRYVNA